MVGTIFPNAFQQGNASIYAFVYLVMAPNIRAQSIPQLRRKTSNLANISQGLHLLGSWPAPWRLESRDKKENKRNVPELYFFISYASPQFWERYELGGRKTRLHSSAPPLPSFSPFHGFSCFLRWLGFLWSLFFFFSFLIPPRNETSKAFLSSSCASMGEGNQNADGDDQEEDTSHNGHLS